MVAELIPEMEARGQDTRAAKAAIGKSHHRRMLRDGGGWHSAIPGMSTLAIMATQGVPGLSFSDLLSS